MGQWVKDITAGVPDNEKAWVRIPKQYFDLGSPWQLISGRFEATAEYADTSYNYVEQYMVKLNDIIGELEVYEPGDLTIDMPTIVPVNPTLRPGFGELEYEERWPSKDGIAQLNLEDLPDFIVKETPPYNVTEPTWKDPQAPELSEIDDPMQRPNIVYPDKVNIELPNIPDPPEIKEVFVPSAPPIIMPEFAGSFEEVDLPDTTGLSWSESPYNSEIWVPFLDRVQDNILNGGTGLLPEVREAIYQQGVNKMTYEHEKTWIKEDTRWANKGWEEPPGAHKARMGELAAEQDREKMDLNRDIMIQDSDLAQKNTHFFMQLGHDAEVVLRNFHNAQQDRILEGATRIAKHSIDILNAYIAKRNSNVEVYKVQVQVYAEKVKALLTTAEIYKAQIEGAKVSAEVQKTYVEIYQAQISAIETLAKYFQTILDGKRTEIEIERLKIEIYKSDVDIYVAKQNAEKIKVDIYAAQVEGEKSKAQVLYNKVLAYIERVKAVKTENELELQRLEYTSKKNNTELERYRAELNAYGIEVDAEAKRLDAIVRGYEGEISAYNAETNALAEYYKTKVEEIRVAVTKAELQVRIEVAKIESVTNAYVAIKELEVKATDGIMSVAAQLAASAMNAVSASASYGYNSNESFGASFNYGASISENHSVPHDPTQ